ncbi:MAG TPA: glutathione S-transferase family protein [Rubrobacter sp.]|nr:glutathione S-transferase family protein [Rubrobacter sp.]
MPEAGNFVESRRAGERSRDAAGKGRRAPTVYHIPVCPFSQRLEILLVLKGCGDLVDFHVVDITRPRPNWLLEKTQGTTALPVLETEDGAIIKESMVILRYLEDRFPEPAVAQRDPYRRAVEGMMAAMEGDFCAWGYQYVLNQDPAKREDFRRGMLERYTRLDEFLTRHNPEGTFLFERFGMAETVFTPFFMRFWFLEYYEGFDLPREEGYYRVRRWREACLAHPVAQQVTREQIVKVYYDYAKGAGNGVLLPGRERSSFVFDPDWTSRPWPPSDKYGHDATDRELGLVP